MKFLPNDLFRSDFPGKKIVCTSYYRTKTSVSYEMICETNLMQPLWFIDQPLAQHVSGNIMPIFRSARPYITAYGFQHCKRQVRLRCWCLHCEHLNLTWQVCWQLASSQAVSKQGWHTPLLCVQWKTPDDGQRKCPKHVEFYSKNKFEKLVHLVGFILRIPSG